MTVNFSHLSQSHQRVSWNYHMEAVLESFDSWLNKVLTSHNNFLFVYQRVWPSSLAKPGHFLECMIPINNHLRKSSVKLLDTHRIMIIILYGQASCILPQAVVLQVQTIPSAQAPPLPLPSLLAGFFTRIP